MPPGEWSCRSDLFRLDVDLIFYDTTTAYFEIDEPDETEQEFAGRLYAPLRRRGHSKEGRDNQPQVIIALAVTRDGMPVRSWVLPGDTADVATVARIKDDLRAWRLGRCLFVGDAGMYADNLAALSRGLGRYILAVPMRKVKDIETAVLTRPGRYKQVADNLLVKEVDRRWRATQTLRPLPQSARGGTRTPAPRSTAARSMPNWPCWTTARRITRRRPVRCWPRSRFGRSVARRRGPAAATGQDQGGGEVRRQVRGDQQRRHAVGRGYRSGIQRRLDHRACFRR